MVGWRVESSRQHSLGGAGGVRSRQEERATRITPQFEHIVSVLGREEGYTVKYGPRDLQREIF